MKKINTTVSIGQDSEVFEQLFDEEHVKESAWGELKYFLCGVVVEIEVDPESGSANVLAFEYRGQRFEERG